MRQYILPHQINDDDWYTMSSVTYHVIAQSSRRPVTTHPYPNVVVYSGLQIKRLHLSIWREVKDTGTTPAPTTNIGYDDYQGHLADGSSVQKHSAGPLYPYVIFAQETIHGLLYGVIGPKKPGGLLVGSYDYAVQYAISLKGDAI